MTRTIRLGMVVVAALVVPACSGAADLTAGGEPQPDGNEAPASTTSPPSIAGDRSTTSILTIPQVAPVVDAPAPAECPPPFAPLASADVFAGSTDRLPAVSGDDVSFRAGPSGELPAGAPTFTNADGGVVDVLPLPDLDGDGDPELLAFTHERRDGLLVPYAYLVHGSAPGRPRRLADVGVRLAEAVVAIDDRDGDGTEDLVEVLDGGPTRVLSGADVAEVEPGGDARHLQPLLVVPGDLLGFADLGGDHPVLVTGELVGQPATSGVVHLADEQGTRRFTTDPEPWVINYSASFAAPTVVTSEAGTYLSLDQSERHAARSYLWRVDDPCGPPL